jgi:hypothetical protein
MVAVGSATTSAHTLAEARLALGGVEQSQLPAAVCHVAGAVDIRDNGGWLRPGKLELVSIMA